MIEVQNVREKNNITRKQLADKLGISSNYLYKYEVGIVEPNIDMLKRMATALSTNVDTIVGYDSPMLDLRKLSENKNKLIDEVLNLTPNQELLVLGYIQRLKEN